MKYDAVWLILARMKWNKKLKVHTNSKSLNIMAYQELIIK